MNTRCRSRLLPSPSPTTALDRPLCAAAQTLGLPLVTRDADIRASGSVKVIW